MNLSSAMWQMMLPLVCTHNTHDLCISKATNKQLKAAFATPHSQLCAGIIIGSLPMCLYTSALIHSEPALAIISALSPIPYVFYFPFLFILVSFLCFSLSLLKQTKRVYPFALYMSLKRETKEGIKGSLIPWQPLSLDPLRSTR